MKNINELTNIKKSPTSELIKELEEISVASQENTRNLKNFINQLEEELAHRRSLGENI